jgi:hypothetical protein
MATSINDDITHKLQLHDQHHTRELETRTGGCDNADKG